MIRLIESWERQRENASLPINSNLGQDIAMGPKSVIPVGAAGGSQIWTQGQKKTAGKNFTKPSGSFMA